MAPTQTYWVVEMTRITLRWWNVVIDAFTAVWSVNHKSNVAPYGAFLPTRYSGFKHWRVDHCYSSNFQLGRTVTERRCTVKEASF